jgi:uncharacterized membrane protein
MEFAPQKGMSEPSEINSQSTVESARKNIEAVVRLEQTSMESRTLGERVSDAITRVIGTMSFVVFHLLLFGFWFGINLGWTPLKPFDPFPFGILTLIVSAEGVLLAIFVLVSQNRMSRQANQRAHLNLQIDMLAEQETTRLLRKVQTLVDHFGLEPEADDREVLGLSQDTHVEALVRELQNSLPEE